MTSTCEYCGAEREAMEFLGHVVAYKTCSCPEAKKKSEKDRLEEEQRDQAAHQQARLDRYRMSGIRKRFIGAETDRIDLVEKVLTGQGLYVYGNMGTGKTYLVSAIAKQLIDQGKRVVMLPSVELLSKIKATYSNDQSEETVLQSFCKCDVLIIDDLGKENKSQSGWVDSMLFRIINERYSEMLPIIITTQFKTPELISRLAGNGSVETATAIVSRIVEMCDGVAMNGNDRRLVRKQNMC